MKLSIIIPVYNAEDTIEKLVKSIAGCTRDGYEILLVDDGSTDNSRAVCQGLAERDNRITVLSKENGGVSSARNYGLDTAQGEYIFFCDSDDFVFAEVLCKAIERLDSGVDLFLFDFIYKDMECGKTKKSSFRLTSEIILNREYIISDILSPLVLKSGTDMAALWHKFFKRNLIEKNNIRFEENVHKGEDWRFVLDYLSVCKTAFYLPEVLYEYRLDGSQSEEKYGKEAGIHLIGSYRRKLELNEKFNLNAGETNVWSWYAGIIGEIVYLSKSDIKIRELHKAICNELVQTSAKILVHTKKQIFIKNEVSRKYRIYALLIRCHMPLLLRIAAKKF